MLGYMGQVCVRVHGQSICQGNGACQLNGAMCMSGYMDEVYVREMGASV